MNPFQQDWQNQQDKNGTPLQPSDARQPIPYPTNPFGHGMAQPNLNEQQQRYFEALKERVQPLRVALPPSLTERVNAALALVQTLTGKDLTEEENRTFVAAHKTLQAYLEAK